MSLENIFNYTHDVGGCSLDPGILIIAEDPRWFLAPDKRILRHSKWELRNMTW